jgi:hypothetical protein
MGLRRNPFRVGANCHLSQGRPHKTRPTLGFESLPFQGSRETRRVVWICILRLGIFATDCVANIVEMRCIRGDSALWNYLCPLVHVGAGFSPHVGPEGPTHMRK